MPFDAESADALQQVIERQQSLTTLHEQGVQSQIAMWAAFRETNTNWLRSLLGWDKDRPYIPDPLPTRISEAFADLLFGEDPTITAAEAIEESRLKEERDLAATRNRTLQQREEIVEEAGLGPDRTALPLDSDDDDEEGNDQERLDNIIEANDLPSELRNAAVTSSSEGEVWWRIYIDPSQMDYPIIQWYSRGLVRPLFRGRRLVAVAFYDEVYSEKVEEEFTVWRWVGIYSAGHVRNLLYRGNDKQLGTKVALSSRPETQNMREDWNHEFEMLAGRIPNKLGRDRRVGVSDYAGVKDLLLSLNEATTVGHENMRLVAKKRAVVPPSALKGGVFDAGEDVLISDEELDTELGKTGGGKFAVLEYSFDAATLKLYKDDVTGVVCTRVGLVQQFLNVGAGQEGLAASGTALRVRLLPTTSAANGKARFFDDAVPKVLLLAQLVDKEEFNRPWNKAGDPPAFERADPLPVDVMEETNLHSGAVGAELESRRTAIKALHPDWTPEQVADEIDTILDETARLTQAVSGGMGGGPDEGPPIEEDSDAEPEGSGDEPPLDEEPPE